MKRFAAILTATLALTATPVNANELEYALAYREQVNRLTEYLEENPEKSEGNITLLESFRLLRYALDRTPQEEMSRVASMKVALCAGDTTTETIVKNIMETHRTNPKTLAFALAKEAYITRAVLIDRLPCEKTMPRIGPKSYGASN